MPDRTGPSMAGLLAAFSLFLLAGGTAVYFLWSELSELLYGRLDEVQFTVLLSAGVALAAVTAALAAYVRRLAPTDNEEST